jgi:hypothetical protein
MVRSLSLKSEVIMVNQFISVGRIKENFFGVVLGFEQGALCLLDTCSST